MSDDPSRYWLGVEKPFPWVGLGVGLLGGVVLAAAAIAATAHGLLPIVEHIIDQDTTAGF
ncbi:hypothetical protein SEA_TAPIOCA_25 [Mycobacterium phage Tapioca]|uniref:Uncharacterized protein n=14 Tax=Caudoviricetes TaxID=2731619 RepID=G1FTW3_9CAUD|nr:hypothetical protein CL81_gp25 [Mycobacterium phage Charlie]YP_010051961.1 hypothetical protein KD929_gp25 [Mycobacterium phage Aggie]YP_010052298.1 hypothetical protein KD934_gp25 [Mycobacterium phage Tapioca]YP_010754817.1 hypothetical protein QEH38_gp28 [Mycobacterium phage LilSpotty]AMS01971.1 hypothetical protein SEA_XERXES_25 [Mycobacterium phage Xerxes]AXQ52595.1 hypothetical protein SEA_GEX_25 [Mycobacterium phage Gex]QBI98582.1 hypothetical protein SEA_PARMESANJOHN_25 [Mycobacteri